MPKSTVMTVLNLMKLMHKLQQGLIFPRHNNSLCKHYVTACFQPLPCLNLKHEFKQQ